MLCGDLTGNESVQARCDDTGSKKNQLRIDDLFDVGDWKNNQVKLKSGMPKFDDRLFHHWQRLDLSGGTLFAHDGKWAQPQFHDGTPSRNIPEPGTVALLGIGLVGAALSRRCKRT